MYSKQTNPVPFTANGGNRPTDEAVRLAVGEGCWMSVQQAIAVTGLTERTLRRHIKRGWVKSRRNGNRSNSPLELWITPEVSKFSEHDDSEDSEVVEIFDAAPTDTDQGEVNIEGPAESSVSHAAPAGEIESILRNITGQFLERLDQSNQLIFELRSELQDKDRQLKLLPDLQKEADEKQVAELKSIALEKQIEELKLLNDQLQRDAEDAAAKLRQSQEKKSMWKWLFSAGSDNK